MNYLWNVPCFHKLDEIYANCYCSQKTWLFDTIFSLENWKLDLSQCLSVRRHDAAAYLRIYCLNTCTSPVYMCKLVNMTHRTLRDWKEIYLGNDGNFLSKFWCEGFGLAFRPLWTWTEPGKHDLKGSVQGSPISLNQMPSPVWGSKKFLKNQTKPDCGITNEQ